MRMSVVAIAAGVAVCLDAGAAAQDRLTQSSPLEPLICRPDGPGPFPLIVWNHGLVQSQARFEQSQSGWSRMCGDLAAEGAIAYLPIRPFALGIGVKDVPRDRAFVQKHLETALKVPGVDPTRVVLMGHSRGATLSLLVAPGRDDLSAVILTATAAIPGATEEALSKLSAVAAPVLLMVEKSDAMKGVQTTKDIEMTLRARGKDVHAIYLDQGGGHFLFVRKDYWWKPFRDYLQGKIGRPS